MDNPEVTLDLTTTPSTPPPSPSLATTNDRALEILNEFASEDGDPEEAELRRLFAQGAEEVIDQCPQLAQSPTVQRLAIMCGHISPSTLENGSAQQAISSSSSNGAGGRCCHPTMRCNSCSEDFSSAPTPVELPPTASPPSASPSPPSASPPPPLGPSQSTEITSENDSPSILQKIGRFVTMVLALARSKLPIDTAVAFLKRHLSAFSRSTFFWF